MLRPFCSLLIKKTLHVYISFWKETFLCYVKTCASEMTANFALIKKQKKVMSHEIDGTSERVHNLSDLQVAFQLFFFAV